jgi:hypothetical protein
MCPPQQFYLLIFIIDAGEVIQGSIFRLYIQAVFRLYSGSIKALFRLY